MGYVRRRRETGGGYPEALGGQDAEHPAECRGEGLVEGETFGGRVLPATLKIAAMATSLIILSGCYAAGLRIDEGNIPDTVNSVASASEASEALGKLEVAPSSSSCGVRDAAL